MSANISTTRATIGDVFKVLGALYMTVWAGTWFAITVGLIHVVGFWQASILYGTISFIGLFAFTAMPGINLYIIGKWIKLEKIGDMVFDRE